MARHRSPSARLSFQPLALCAAAVGTSSGTHAAPSITLGARTNVLLAAVASGGLAIAGHTIAVHAASGVTDASVDAVAPVDPAQDLPTPPAPDALGPPVDGATLVKAARLGLQSGFVAAPPTSAARGVVAPAPARRASAPPVPVAPTPAAAAPAAPAVPAPPAAAAAVPAPPTAAKAVTPPVAPPAPAPVKPAAKPVAPAVVAGGFARPVVGVVTSGFGARSGGFHYGLDIANKIGTPIHAVAAGTVISAGPASGFGLWVRIRHDDGTITVYGHMNRFFVHVGQRVAAGEVIAEVGQRGQATGPHLHIEVQLPSGQRVDPRQWLAARGIAV